MHINNGNYEHYNSPLFIQCVLETHAQASNDGRVRNIGIRYVYTLKVCGVPFIYHLSTCIQI